MYYIYKITNQKNNKSYIGFTNNPKVRWNSHKSCSKRTYRPLYNAMRKYGIENFEFQVIYESEDRENTLLVMEPYYIKMYNTYAQGYNCNLGGADTNTYKMRENASKRMKIENPMKNISNHAGWFKKGQKPIITKERNEKIRDSKLGDKNHNFGNHQAAKHLNTIKVECEYCNKSMTRGNYTRWHGKKCKSITEIV